MLLICRFLTVNGTPIRKQNFKAKNSLEKWKNENRCYLVVSGLETQRGQKLQNRGYQLSLIQYLWMVNSAFCVWKTQSKMLRRNTSECVFMKNSVYLSVLKNKFHVGKGLFLPIHPTPSAFKHEIKHCLAWQNK